MKFTLSKREKLGLAAVLVMLLFAVWFYKGTHPAQTARSRGDTIPDKYKPDETQAFLCDLYSDAEEFSQILEVSFKVGDSKEHIESVLVKECSAKVKYFNVHETKNGGVDGMFTYTFGEDKSSLVIVHYKENLVWELWLNTKRILPGEGYGLDLKGFENKPEIEVIRNNPELFRFEYFSQKSELIQAIEYLLSHSSTREDVDTLFVEGGRAVSGPVYSGSQETRNGQDSSVGYTYFLPTLDGRKSAFSMRLVKAVFGQDGKLKRVMVGSREAKLNGGK